MKTYFMLSRLYKPVNLNLQTNLYVLFFRYLKVEFRVLVQTTDLLLHPPPKKTKLISREKKMKLWSVYFLVVLQPCVFPAGEDVVLGLHTV